MKHLTQLAVLITSVFVGTLLQGQVPTILNQPASQTNAVGTNFTLQVVAVGSDMAYQWYQVTNSGHTTNVLASGTNSAYAVTSAGYTDAGGYFAIIGNGSGTVTSALATVTVLAKPSVTTPPASVTVASGGTAPVLTVSAAGDSLHYQWKVGGTNAPGGTDSASYTLGGSTTTYSGTYSVIVSNAVGTATSAGAVVTFVDAPVITSATSTNVYVATGSSVSFSVTATGIGLSYQWDIGGTLIPGATNSTYTWNDAQSNLDNGVYTVTVSNIKSPAATASYTLKVLDVPVITTDLISSNAQVGHDITLTVAATGSVGGSGATTNHFVWKKGSTVLINSTSSTYLVTATVANSGVYSVTVSNSVGTANSASATLLFVDVPAVQTQPVGKAVGTGTNYTISVVMSNAATSLLNYQWYKSTSSSASNAVSASATNSALVVDTSSVSSNNYYVFVTNLAGPTNSITNAVVVQDPPVIGTQPTNNVTVGEGTNVTLTVSATGTALAYQWFYGSTAITGSNATTLNFIAKVTNSGAYSVQVSNLVSKVVSANATVLAVNPPAWTTQPVSQGAVVGGSATFSAVCANASSSALSYFWRYAGTIIPGATNSSYTVSSITTASNGNYSVIVSNVAGTITSSNAVLTVQTAPNITASPTSTTNNSGTTLTLSVTATGGLLGYQWYNGTNLLSSNFVSGNTLAIPAAQPTNSGSYFVIVTNAAGTATSDVATVWVLAKPVILVNPASAAVVSGSSQTLSVTVDNADNSLLSYQWYFGTNASASLACTNAIDSATTNSLSFSGITSDANGAYCVVVSNLAGAATSAVATLTVQIPPAITVDLQGGTIVATHELDLGVSVTGDSLYYQWFKDGAKMSYAGFGSNAYTVLSAASTDSGVYSVVVTNLVGIATSSTATVYVVTTPSITTQPASKILTQGSDWTFGIYASDAANSPLTYQWYFDSGSGATAIPGATLSNLTLYGVVTNNQGSYSVTVSNLAGVTTSSSAVLTVVSYPTILAQPASTNVATNYGFTLTFGAGGQSLVYEWYKNGVALHSNFSTLTITSSKVSDSGTYYATATNTLGKVTSANAVVLAVAKPAIKTAPVGGTNRIGTTMTFTVVCSNAASSLLNYQWYCNGNALPNATNSELDLPNVSSADSGAYTVVITNLAGSITSTAVTFLGQGLPSIDTQPVGTNVAVHQGITLSVGASGDTLQYIWKKNGVALGAASSSSSLVIASAATTDSGAYTVTVTNSVGTNTSTAVNVLVVDVPVISSATGGTNIVIVGNDFTLSNTVANAANQLPNYQWIYNSNLVLNGATSATYTVQGASPASSGYYQVIVTNLAGATSNTPAYLLVEATPSITSDISGGVYGIGTNVTLTVGASGAGIGYQWKKNGSAITGSNLNNVTFTSAAYSSNTYAVTITNSAGTANSANASVFFVAPPSLVEAPTNLMIAEWQPVSFKIKLANEAVSHFSYQWSFNGSPLVDDGDTVFGSISSNLIIAGAGTGDAGTYSVVATNVAGSIAKSATLTIETLPTFTQKPVGADKGTGSNYTFTAVATGNNLSNQWYKGSTAVGSLTAGGSASLALTGMGTNVSGNYHVIFSNDAGSTNSGDVTLNVVDAPVISTQPLDVNAALNGGFTMRAVVTNTPAALLTYQWASTNTFGATPHNLDNAISDTYQLGGLQYSDAGGYTVLVSNVAGTTLSRIAQVLVQASPTIVTDLFNITVGVTTNLNQNVTAGGDNVTIKWYMSGSATPIQSTNATAAGPTSDTYNIPSTAVTDSGDYYVIASNKVGAATSSVAIVTVLGVPTIVSQTLNKYVGLGTNYIMSVNASGSGLRYIWGITNTGSFTVVGGNASSYTLPGTNAYSTNQYAVWVTNIAGGLYSTNAFVVAEQLPGIATVTTSNLTGANIGAKGSNVVLNVAATGDLLTYQWYKGGVALASGTAATSNLVITSAQVTDSGIYTVVVANDVGSVTNTPLNVLIVSPATIAVQPTGGTVTIVSPAATHAASNFTFTVSMIGATNSALGYQWYSQTNGASSATAVTTATATNYTVATPGINGTGQYFVVVSNVAGWATSSVVTLNVQHIPTVAAGGGLTNAFFPSGIDVSIGVTTNGEGVGVLWYKGTNTSGTFLQGGTATNYTITAPTLTDSSNYFAILTNAVGSVTSGPVFIQFIDGPVITSQPMGIVATNGYTNYTFRVGVSNASISQVSYQWWTVTNGHAASKITGATSNYLTLNTLGTNMTGDYYVVVTNIASTTTSSNATLTVQNMPGISPQPAASTVVGVGTNFSLSITASGEGVGYQWYKDGSALTGETSASYANPGTATAGSSVYYVVVTNAVNTTGLQSSNATVVVVDPPIISIPPIGGIKVTNSSYTFSVIMSNSASATAQMTYLWYVTNGATLNYDPANVIQSNSTSSFRIGTIKATNAGLYSVVVSNKAGWATSAPVSLVVETKPTLSISPVSTVLAVSNANLGIGVTNLVATAAGNNLTYIWKHGATVLGETSNTLLLTNLATNDAGTYSVTVTNDAGSITNSATVSVVDIPVITAQPQGKVLRTNENYTFTVIVTNAASQLVSYQWYLVTNSVPLSAPVTNALTAWTSSNTFKLTGVSTNDSGTYFVVVSNVAAVAQSSNAVIAVQTLPKITTNLVATNFAAGNPGTNLSLTIGASGIGLVYQWVKDGTSLTNGINTYGSLTNQTLGADTATLTVSGAMTNDSGKYSVIVSNGLGAVTSAVVRVWVVVPPAIESQPQGLSIATSSSYTFSVIVSNAASSALSYQWFKGGTNAGSNITATITNSYYKITGAAVTNSGDYYVLITNVAGAVYSSPATLTVLAKPAFDTQPSSTNYATNSAITLAASANGGSVTYIFKKGTNTLGANNTGTYAVTTSALVSDSGTYTVLASNIVGVTSSTNATILVVAKPAFQVGLSNISVGAGSNYTFSVTISNASTSLLSYQWFSDAAGTAISGATTNTYKLAGVTSGGTYVVVVTNLAGRVSNTAVLSINNKPAFSLNLSNVNVATNAALTLYVTASGTSPTYTWKKGSTTLSTYTTDTLLISHATLGDAGTYSVTVSNAAGSVTSSNSIVQVIAPPAYQSQPKGGAVVTGASSSFTFTAILSNAASSALTYRWKFGTATNNATNLVDGTANAVWGTPFVNITVSGATNNVLKITGITNNLDVANGHFYLFAVNIAGTTVSTNADLVVQTKAVFTNDLTNVVVGAGSNLNLVGRASGTSVSYQWRKNGSAIRGATATNLAFTGIKVSDSATYTLAASNKVGQAISSNAVVLVVNTPAIQTQPAGKSVGPGSNVTLTVSASNAASSALTYVWRKNSTATDSGASTVGTSSSTLTLSGVSSSADAYYAVIVTNVAGYSTSSWVKVNVEVKPVITVPFASTNIILGAGPASNLSLAITATGDNLVYTWTRGSTRLISGSDTTNKTWIVNGLTTNDSGTYTVLVTNHLGSASNVAKVLVVSAPTILTNLTTNVTTNIAVAAGSNYTFKVVAANATNSALRYFWYYNSNLWSDVRATNNTLTVTNVSTNMYVERGQGVYQVVVSNISGYVTSTAYLTVQTKPGITTQPTATTVVSNGTPVTLSVTATGDALGYQWRKTLTGTTVTNLINQTNSTLALAGATNDAGKYTVVVTNLVGGVTSAIAKVSIVYSNASGLKTVSESSVTANANVAAGDYAGLFVAADGVATYDTAGSVAINVTASGAYSGKLALRGSALLISGQFNDAGTASAQFTLADGSSIALNLATNAGLQQLTGTVSGSGWTSVLTADRAVFSAASAAPFSGIYGITFPTDEGASLGSGTAIVSASGAIQFVGATAAGLSISQSASVSKDGYWPFFIIDSEGVEIIGWIQFVNGKPSGVINWIDAAGTAATSHAVGANYTE